MSYLMTLESAVLEHSPARKTQSFLVATERAPAFIDITERVAEAVAASGVRDGFAVVFSRHTTAAVRINENEPLLIADMEDFLARLAPAAATYRHNDFEVRTVNMTPDEVPNGHAHCQSLLLGASEMVPVDDGELGLGRWQRIFLVELDHPRLREVVVKVVGT
jgi:secondary thiamine-phosphate synthase enzyme